MKKGIKMGKLIIDGNSVFEIDEQCLKRRKVPKDCQIEKYMKNNIEDSKKREEKYIGTKKN